MRKLHQTGNPVEVAQNEYCIGNNTSAKSGTKPGQKSNSNFWVGDGAGQECCNHALDGQGTALSDDVLEMKSTVSNCSLAHKQRHEQKKKDAREAATANNVSFS